MLTIILFNLLLLIYLLANFPHVFRFSSTFLRAHIAPWPTLHYWTTNKPICPEQFQTKAAASPPTLYGVSLSEPCRNHNKQTDSERERGRQGGGLSDRAETTLLLCLDWRGVWHLANLNQKTITHGQGKLFATRNWLPDKRFYIPTYLFLSFCARDLLMCNPGEMARMRLELKLKLRLRLEGKQKQDLCIVA